MTMKGRHKATVFSALTQGTFGFEDLLRRQNTICGPQVLGVCKPKAWLGAGISQCRACAEAFQDFDRILQNDRRDIDVGSLGVKAHKKTVSAADRQFRGRHHVWQKSQELCTTVQQRHPAKRGERPNDARDSARLPAPVVVHDGMRRTHQHVPQEPVS